LFDSSFILYPFFSFDGMVGGSYDKPKGTVHIVNGAAGQPFLADFVEPRPLWNAYRSNTYGFGRIEADSGGASSCL
jgi:hypothetical protein